MSKALSEWMTLYIAINIIFTPILAYLDSLHREAVEVVLTEGAKKAAIEGYFSESNVNDMKDTLVNKYNFSKDTIRITTPTGSTPVPRNQYIEASIEVPRGFIFLLDIFNPGPSKFKKDTKILSEYIS